MTPLPRRGFGPPLVRYVFHPPQVSVLCFFSCAKIHDRAAQKLLWRGPKFFGRARSLVRFQNKSQCIIYVLALVKAQLGEPSLGTLIFFVSSFFLFFSAKNRHLVAQCSATPATVAATPPCSATPFQTQISVRHLRGQGGGRCDTKILGSVARHRCYTCKTL